MTSLLSPKLPGLDLGDGLWIFLLGLHGRSHYPHTESPSWERDWEELKKN
jgi:hypothetical protein